MKLTHLDSLKSQYRHGEEYSVVLGQIADKHNLQNHALLLNFTTSDEYG